MLKKSSRTIENNNSSVPRRRRWHRWLRRGFAAIFVLGLLTAISIFLINWRVEFMGNDRLLTFAQLSGQPAYDCVIVPGALVHEDGTPSGMLADRLDMAVKIYRSGVTDRILVSGDHGRPDYNEVGVMRQYLIDAGIPAEHIFMDHAGFDTYDTVYRAESIFGVKRALITTQDFHLPRALYIGVQLDLDLQGVDCGYSHTTANIYYTFREYPARVKAWLDCEILHISPTFGGEPIPISGDGRATLELAEKLPD